MAYLADLFEFAADVGKKLFNKEEEAATKLKDMIASEPTMPIENLDVSFKDGVVTLCGDCDSAATRQKAILMAGNVKGVREIVADDLKAPAAQKKEEEEVKYYVIRKGDTLSKIAKEFYGNAMEYPKIFEANREVIKDADLIYPGQKIRIPPA
jgi:nucleoid-associated protein YgaU